MKATKVTKTITKRQIIKALEKEPLMREVFFDGANWMKDEAKVGCKVCAVGAVLRKMSFEKWARNNGVPLHALGAFITKGEAQYDDAKELIKKKNYLGALSNYFEAGNGRKKCISFVKTYFPPVLELTASKRRVENFGK